MFFGNRRTDGSDGKGDRPDSPPDLHTTTNHVPNVGVQPESRGTNVGTGRSRDQLQGGIGQASANGNGEDGPTRVGPLADPCEPRHHNPRPRANPEPQRSYARVRRARNTNWGGHIDTRPTELTREGSEPNNSDHRPRWRGLRPPRKRSDPGGVTW